MSLFPWTGVRESGYVIFATVRQRLTRFHWNNWSQSYNILLSFLSWGTVATSSAWIACNSMWGLKSKKAGSTSSALRYFRAPCLWWQNDLTHICFSAQKACIRTTSLCCVGKTRACCCSTSRWWWGGCLHRIQTPDGALLPTAPLLWWLQDAPLAPESAVGGRDARRASATTARQSGTLTRPATWHEPNVSHCGPALSPSRKTLVFRVVVLNWRCVPDVQSSLWKWTTAVATTWPVQVNYHSNDLPSFVKHCIAEIIFRK